MKMKQNNRTRRLNNRLKRHAAPRGELIGVIFKTLFLCLILGVAASFLWVAWWVDGVLAETPSLNTNLIFREGASIIYDRDGVPFSEGDGERREWVQFHEIAPVMIDAILAIEDARFFDHPGVDWSRTIVAVMYTVENMLTGNQSTQGGSTLTQQLVNQTHLLLEDGTRDNTIGRKLQEILLAMQIEREFSKEQIIEAYLNYAPFGGRIFGIQAAAEFYFGVDAIDLTLSQAATLAGLVQLPNAYRPDTNADNAQERRNTVLYLMVRHGFITQSIADLAAAEPLTDLLIYQEIAAAHTAGRYESFVNLVFEEAETRFGITNPHAGYEIFTTLDREAQAAIHSMLHTNSHIQWPNDNIQQAVVLLGNDGAIRALGGRDIMNRQNIQRGFNLPVHMERQVGSASKPIWAYGPAFELLNWGTGSMIDDRPFGYDWTMVGSPMVHNWERQYRGRVSVRNAMDWSWNVPAILTYLEVVNTYGQQAMDSFVNSLGVPTPPNGFNSRYAIGGNEYGFSVLQMAGAYSAFANGGTFNQPFTITRIVAPDGRIIYGDEYHHSERVMRESTAYMMSSILRSTLTQGTGQWQALVPGQWVAGKTGTTNFSNEIMRAFPHINGVPDSWFVGYSMDYTVAVWTGYPSVSDGTFLNSYQQNFSQRMFRYIMTEFNTAGNNQPTRPSNIVNTNVEWASGNYNGEVCLPSYYTPPGAVRDGGLRRNTAWTIDELFVRGHEPICTSTRFEAPAVPENFRVYSSDGSSITFEWDHIDSLPMSWDDAQYARNHANALGRGLTHITEGLLDLAVSEDQANMMLDKIYAIGQTEYVVMGRIGQGEGESIELGSTNSSYLTVHLSFSEATSISEFYVVTRFSYGGRISAPSNSITNTGFIDLDNIFTPDNGGTPGDGNLNNNNNNNNGGDPSPGLPNAPGGGLAPGGGNDEDDDEEEPDLPLGVDM